MCLSLKNETKSNNDIKIGENFKVKALTPGKRKELEKRLLFTGCQL